METSNKLRFANILRYFARSTMTIIGIVTFTFALISGSDAYGGGLKGLILNSPNTLPWLALIALIIFTWKKELSGGIIISLFGLGMTYFFNTGPNFFLSTLILTSLITVSGSLFIGSSYLRK